ncbi:hypothetical protein [Rugosimonospora africana]|uniref:Capsular polysaccharide biosynthesis protein n=1 Tax=Rugosimonospora africana TaxID=556532 RepID=A0A8J3QRT5_9ACTN|nr:hypothetical protein [Rugosimonospora africana]GIH16320.1 hypothetical protein Raf01_44920 [Rugosimonospora africana]
MSRSFDVRATLRAARRYLVVPLLGAGIGLVAAQPVTHRMPATYEASASLVITASTVDATTKAKVADLALAQNLLPTVAQLAQSREVALFTATSLGLPPSAVAGHVKSSHQPGTQIVTIRATAASATDAAAIANAATQATVRQFALLQIGVGGNVATQILDEASPPAAPVSPNRRLNDALGALVGLLAGLGVGWLDGRVDNRLRRPAKLAGELGLPLLGIFPRLPGRYARHNARTLYTRRGVADSVAGTVAALAVLTSPLRSRRLLVTSVHDDDGKGLVSALLSLAMSEGQDRVTLIEGEPHRPGIGGHFPEAAECTLAKALADNRAVAPLPGSATLSVIAAARRKRTDPAPSNAQKIGSREIGGLVNAAADGGGIAIVHAPPVLAGADLAALTRYADGLLLVVRTGVTRRAEAQRAAMLIRQLDLPVVGIVAIDAAGQTRPERYQSLTLPTRQPAAVEVAAASAPAPMPAAAALPAVAAPAPIQPPLPAGQPVLAPAASAAQAETPAAHAAPRHALTNGTPEALPRTAPEVGISLATRHRRQETVDALSAPFAVLTESLELAALADEDTVHPAAAAKGSGGDQTASRGSHTNTGLDQPWQLSTGRSVPGSRYAETYQPREFA